MHATDGKISYFKDYLERLDVFLYKESLGLTVWEYMRLVRELETIKHYIKYLEFNELINIEVTL